MPFRPGRWRHPPHRASRRAQAVRAIGVAADDVKMAGGVYAGHFHAAALFVEEVEQLPRGGHESLFTDDKGMRAGITKGENVVPGRCKGRKIHADKAVFQRCDRRGADGFARFGQKGEGFCGNVLRQSLLARRGQIAAVALGDAAFAQVKAAGVFRLYTVHAHVADGQAHLFAAAGQDTLHGHVHRKGGRLVTR